MMIRVRMFAVARDMAQDEVVELAFPQQPTVAELSAALAQQVPGLRSVLAHSILVVNEEPVPPETVVPPGAEVALIPPVSGG